MFMFGTNVYSNLKKLFSVFFTFYLFYLSLNCDGSISKYGLSISM